MRPKNTIKCFLLFDCTPFSLALFELVWIYLTQHMGGPIIGKLKYYCVYFAWYIKVSLCQQCKVKYYIKFVHPFLVLLNEVTLSFDLMLHILQFITMQ